MLSSKQLAAARRNIKKAQQAAKRGINKVDRAVRNTNAAFKDEAREYTRNSKGTKRALKAAGHEPGNIARTYKGLYAMEYRNTRESGATRAFTSFVEGAYKRRVTRAKRAGTRGRMNKR